MFNVSLLGSKVPTIINDLAVLYVFVLGAYQLVIAITHLFKYDEYTHHDNRIAVILDLFIMHVMGLSLLFLLRGVNLYIISYYIHNLLFFLNILMLVPMFLMAISKHNYKSILGLEGDEYVKVMNAIKVRRITGFVLLIIYLLLFKLSITLYPSGFGKMYPVLLFMLLFVFIIKSLYYKNHTIITQSSETGRESRIINKMQSYIQNNTGNNSDEN